MKKIILFFLMIFLSIPGLFVLKAQAAQLEVSITASDGSDGETLLDDDYRSTEHFEGGTELTINAPEPIKSVYIKWDSIPSAWTMLDGGTQISCGENGFLHEFVSLSGTSTSATIRIPSGGADVADIFVFSDGELPDFVQQWQASWDKADILFISTHSDDEVLFFGGMIPIYTNQNRARVQVAYFSDFFLSESYRNHELLDGIWTMGVDHYPQLGRFYDEYSESLEEAEGQFDHEESLAYIVETIRRFQPQVVVTHDVNGEYGHGGHMYVSKLVREAVDGVAADAARYPESAGSYGAWDVPKTYLHLYPENTIETGTRVPLEDFGGRTALEVAKEAYLRHGSQQWMWFYVDDGYDEAGNPNDYKFSCARYGLYRTTVGPDTGSNDVLENITTYDTQEKGSGTDPGTKPDSSSDKEEKKETGGHTWLILIIIILVLLAVFIIVLLLVKKRQRQREEMERRARARRRAMQAERRRNSEIPADREAAYRSRSERSSSGRSRSAGSTGRPEPAGRGGYRREIERTGNRGEYERTSYRGEYERGTEQRSRNERNSYYRNIGEKNGYNRGQGERSQRGRTTGNRRPGNGR